MRLFVPLTARDLDTLLALARAERRRPQDQAAVLLSRVLAARLSTADRPPVAADRVDGLPPGPTVPRAGGEG